MHDAFTGVVQFVVRHLSALHRPSPMSAKRRKKTIVSSILAALVAVIDATLSVRAIVWTQRAP